MHCGRSLRAINACEGYGSDPPLPSRDDVADGPCELDRTAGDARAEVPEQVLERNALPIRDLPYRGLLHDLVSSLLRRSNTNSQLHSERPATCPLAEKADREFTDGLVHMGWRRNFMDEHWNDLFQEVDEACGITNSLSHALGGDELRLCTIAGNVNNAITVCE